jgi:hypothetical protein
VTTSHASSLAVVVVGICDDRVERRDVFADPTSVSTKEGVPGGSLMPIQRRRMHPAL